MKSAVKIHITKKQRKILQPLMNVAESAYQKGGDKRGFIIIQPDDDLRGA